MRNFKTEGIVVRRHNLGEADRIITVFTPHYGKISIKAAGVRKITSKRAAHIELLNHSVLHLYKGTGMHVLTEVTMVDDFADIKKDFGKIGLAYHLCELVDSLCPENQENHAVFTLLQKTLGQIASQDALSNYYYDALAIEDYTLGPFGYTLRDEAHCSEQMMGEGDILRQFEVSLLSNLGYWDKNDSKSRGIDTQAVIESIIERRLKSRSVFSKLY